MQLRRLGNSGLKVSVIGLGCSNFGMRIDQAQTRMVVDAALDCGVNFFDTADIYGASKSEVFLGEALKGKRDKAVLATKFANPMGEGEYLRGGARRYIVKAVEDSLKRLHTDHIDLYQMHVPDADTPIEETLRALDDLVRAGKVLYIGNSNFTGWQIADADWSSRTQGLERFVSAQNNFSLLERGVESEVLPACERFGLGLLPYFPLASGFLTGKYRRGEPPRQGTRLAAWGKRGAAALSERNFDRLEALEQWAEQRGRRILDLAFAWLLGHRAVSSVIAGATSPEQVQANARCAEWILTPEEVEEVRALLA
ncbi:MAG: aldo/keto reductase [Phenylobacterium sp.]|uniref:aldo/keto reductase n=2 Tax=Phenylobacterium sp. TaxID=1871053 RepID=UPI0025F6D3AF|nr:aldo/keto reductase [Phenylobacterium sp.]MCA3731665.1 aldo/keto reductase [Phenylobacterium sp.]MCA3736390.1 aldo/keto reductase [Phenylobacterium sp.]MCA3746255.1 aldo/keto reductase [Phenylobacterium sp.]MCA3751445.1 aldo/keto reductase [Phenylobacterium sp.]MCA6276267.1 aldo/keto reductase [Phenylobacterium sp.]